MLDLWQHQKDALPYMKAGHFLCAFDPGLGKTLTAMTAMRELGPGAKHAVIVPPYLIPQWKGLLEQMGFRVHAIRSGKQFKFDIDQVDVVITSYNLVRTKMVWLAIMQHRWDSVTLDESHNAKNTSAKTTKAIFGVNKKSKAIYLQTDRMWLLTGTPVDKDPVDLWAMLSRLFPERLAAKEIYTKADFTNYFCICQETSYGPKVVGTRREDELAEIIDGIVMRVEDDGTIRPKLVIDEIRVDAEEIDLSLLTDEAREVMEELLAELRNEDPDMDVISRAEIFLSTLRRLIGEAKVDSLGKLVNDELASGKSKIVVFYTHVTVGEKLEQYLNAIRPDVAVRVGGGIPQADREERKHRFQHDPSCRVYIGQMQATGEGLDGLQVANRVLIAEPAWTPRPNVQAIRRVARGGSEHDTVYASYILVGGSIDEVVRLTADRREKMIRKVFGNEADD